jgi:hypothetical protein
LNQLRTHQTFGITLHTQAIMCAPAGQLARLPSILAAYLTLFTCMIMSTPYAEHGQSGNVLEVSKSVLAIPSCCLMPMLLYLLLLHQVQVPKHVLRVFSDDGGQEKVEIQVLLPGECCCGPRHLSS